MLVLSCCLLPYHTCMSLLSISRAVWVQHPCQWCHAANTVVMKSLLYSHTENSEIKLAQESGYRQPAQQQLWHPLGLKLVRRRRNEFGFGGSFCCWAVLVKAGWGVCGLQVQPNKQHALQWGKPSLLAQEGMCSHHRLGRNWTWNRAEPVL